MLTVCTAVLNLRLIRIPICEERDLPDWQVPFYRRYAEVSIAAQGEMTYNIKTRQTAEEELD